MCTANSTTKRPSFISPEISSCHEMLTSLSKTLASTSKSQFDREAITARNTCEPRFFSLTGEMRNEIYHHTLKGGVYIRAYSVGHHGSQKRKNCLSLLASYRQIQSRTGWSSLTSPASFIISLPLSIALVTVYLHVETDPQAASSEPYHYRRYMTPTSVTPATTLSISSRPQFEVGMAEHTSRSSEIASHNSDASPLLRLPGEIKNEIYEYVLGEDVYVFVIDTVTPTTQGEERLALLQVCREIYNETRLLPFSLNTFSFSNFNGFYEFIIKSTTTQQRQAVRSLDLSICLSCCTEDMKVFEKRQMYSLSDVLPGLQYVSVVKYDVNCNSIATVEERQKKVEQWVRCGFDERVAMDISFKDRWWALCGRRCD